VPMDGALRQFVLSCQETKRMALRAVLADLTKLRMTTNLAGLRHLFIYPRIWAFTCPGSRTDISGVTTGGFSARLVPALGTLHV
jgi:hypothetical protein